MIPDSHASTAVCGTLLVLVLIGSEYPGDMEVTQQHLSRLAKSGSLRLPRSTTSSDPRWTVKKTCGHFLVNGCHLLP